MGEGAASLSYILAGVNHRTASLGLRDRLFVEDSELAAALVQLKAAGIDQAVLLATCDRVEIVAAVPSIEAGHSKIWSFLAGRAGLDVQALAAQGYAKSDEAAVGHFFAVAAALDSQVVGEPQVLGQVKAAHRFARDAGLSGKAMEALCQAAFGAAKRVRSETRIGEGPVSMAAAAVQLARDLHGDLGRAEGLLLGDGDMGMLAAEGLLASGLRRLSIAAPRQSRAESAARGLGAHVAPFAELAERLVSADVLIAALGGPHCVVTAAQVQDALRKRKRRPILIIDAALPGDVEPAVDRVDGAFLYDLDDLEQVAHEGRREREAAASQAQAILDLEVAAFLKHRAERLAVPAIVALRHHFEALREQALAEAHGDAEKATRLMMNRLLHAPSEVLKEAGEAGEAPALEALLARLFRLDDKKDEA